LFDMLSDLAKNSQALSDFKKDPDATMTKYGLSDDQKKKIKNSMNGQHADFTKVVQDEVKAHSLAIFDAP
ncbi:MAG: hypothetical protein KDC99_19820, partial [Cyclobacteriaceae bacterium]|nr:hypothetical protein [Cyclobacteriaceae bacterium]